MRREKFGLLAAPWGLAAGHNEGAAIGNALNRDLPRAKKVMIEGRVY